MSTAKADVLAGEEVAAMLLSSTRSTHHCLPIDWESSNTSATRGHDIVSYWSVWRSGEKMSSLLSSVLAVLSCIATVDRKRGQTADVVFFVCFVIGSKNEQTTSTLLNCIDMKVFGRFYSWCLLSLLPWCAAVYLDLAWRWAGSRILIDNPCWLGRHSSLNIGKKKDKYRLLRREDLNWYNLDAVSRRL